MNDDMMMDDDMMVDDTDLVGVAFGQFFVPADATGFKTDANGGTGNRFELGIGAEDSFPTVLQFDGSLFNAEPQESFKVGQIFYQNGILESGSFNGAFAFSIDLDLAGTDDDPDPFVYLFDILTTPNDPNDNISDADILRFSSGGVTPQIFEVDNDLYTLELRGFSQDGGQTFDNIFDSPEEGFDIASLYGRLIKITDNPDSDEPSIPSVFFTTLTETTVTEIQVAGGVFIGGSSGFVAGSVVIDDASQLSTLWGINAGAAISFSSQTTFEISSTTTTTIDFEAFGITAAIGSVEDDDVEGSSGNDAIDGNDGSDVLEGNDGNDVLTGSDGNDTLMGGDGTDCVYGNRGDDLVSGGDGDDFVRGGQGNDRVLGDDGDDVLTGDNGIDILTGGDGSDVFLVKAEFDSNEFSTDLIADFTVGEDSIALSANVAVSFEVRDFNADGTDDVGIKLVETGSFISFVLGTDSIASVENSITIVPEGDFALV
ncbi:MAG: choice-of-anchor K domain-containing protein [Cyanobacteriota bacterium]|nr:choice-of-anchor K domain-containing protein [Cyanobacteriota bacterium]